MLEVGTRVKCVNDSDLNGKEGTIERTFEDTPFPYGIRWDCRTGEPGDFSQGGRWSDDAIHPVAQPSERELRLEAAVEVAAFVFAQYKEYHLAKDTNEAMMKALTNLGLENLMLDALEAD